MNAEEFFRELLTFWRGCGVGCGVGVRWGGVVRVVYS